MILRNTTYSIDSVEFENWFHWLENTFMQQILITGLVVDYKVLKMLDEPDQTNETIALQIFFNDAADFNDYIRIFSSKHDKLMNDAFAGKFSAFVTFLKVLKY